jgi:hypothetical protein
VDLRFQRTGGDGAANVEVLEVRGELDIQIGSRAGERRSGS